MEEGRKDKATRSSSRKVLSYSFSKVARMTFLSRSRSWQDFRERTYAEMEKIDFQGVPLSGFRSPMLCVRACSQGACVVDYSCISPRVHLWYKPLVFSHCHERVRDGR